MSLFGESPPASRPTKSSLFDEGSAGRGGSGLFADDSATNSTSAWDFPTPKKAARRNVVKTLLRDDEVPEAYIDAYDRLLSSESGSGGVSLESARRLLAGSGIGGGEQSKILEIVGGSPEGLSRAEFNVLFALIGLAQEGEELSLDAVDERKQHLPTPSIASLKASPKQERTAPTSMGPPQSTPGANQSQRQQPFGGGSFGESDPWGAPALHKGHDHSGQQNGSAYPNGAATREPVARTTSTFTTAADDTPPTSAAPYTTPQQDTTPASGPAWGGFEGTASDSFTGEGTAEEPGFGAPASAGNNGPSSYARPTVSSKRSSAGQEERVLVNSLEEKEGLFMFQHRNYEVSSVRRNSKVIRRYSDFVWLLDCLHKRYPFRQLPLLPPKRVAINGNHIAADALFIEKRRRGLARFANALVRHPVLREEQLVVMFLTVPTELSVWRKQATISVQEEFTGKTLPPGLEDSLSPTLQDLFDTVRSGVRRSAEIHINLCTMVEKLTKYNVGLAAEYMRVSLALESLLETSQDTYAIDTNDVPMLNEGLQSTAKHLSTNKSLLEDEGRAWDMGVLEDIKRQRDCLVSMRDMFDRRDRFAKDNIPQLEKRISASESKLQGLRSKPEGMVKPGEVEKVEASIHKDKKSIVDQHARGVFIKECIRDEILFFNTSQYHISRLHQDWSQERVKYAELAADNWKALSDEVESMPTGES